MFTCFTYRVNSPSGSTFFPFFTGQILDVFSAISSGSPHDTQFQFPALTDQSPFFYFILLSI